jgi:type IV pilus assembly protein PilM
MALSLRKNSARGTVGLDLDGTFIAAVQASTDGAVRAASVDLAPGIISEGEVTDVPALTEALKDFFKARSLPRRVRLGVANQQIVVRHLELPKIEDVKERQAAVRFQAAEAIAMPLDEVVLDHQVIGEAVSPEGSARYRVVVVAARESMIAKIVDAARGAGLRPEGIDLNAFALVRTLAIPSDTTETSRVYCHLGGVTNLAIAVGPICHFTRALSTVWDVEEHEGEQTIAAALAEEIRLSIDFYMAQPEARWVGEIVLSGPGSRRPGLSEELGGLIDVPVTVAEPLGRLQADRLPAGEDPHRHTVAAGLAMGAAA